ncbi:MAG: alkane 1-monooxygenase [Chitinophagia bacterium]|jgi:alkane 1-monooxygenase
MQGRHLKFLLPFSLFVLAYLAFTQKGWLIASPVIYAFGFIPLVELLIPLSKENMSEAEEKIAKEDRLYDWWLYIIVPLQYAALACFLFSMQDQGLTAWEKAGRIASMGLLCAAFGINVGHELGHRRLLYERNLAKALLLTSLYMHFYIEHNKGHHKNVSTKEDPSSARKWEPIYLFYFRTVIFGYISAWKIAADDQKKKGKPVLHFSNQMIQFQLLQILFVLLVQYVFGTEIMLSFLAAASIGFLLLETVNYIEHYGLERKNTDEGYERAMPEHSWNSSHILGRLMLFELSRHSDHHYLASRKYQVLRHHDEAPQMPTGYPGMMILSLVPPLWFSVMHKRMNAFQKSA